jgi:DTW domain-containing protein YfiP
MRAESGAKRLHCAACLRPQSSCICQWIAPVAHQVEVLILQHPLEVDQAKGSARLLHLSLPHSRLVTGETFSEAQLRALLEEPFDTQAAAGGADSVGHKQALLLYPHSPQDQALGLPVPPALAPALLREPARLRLVVLDGTVAAPVAAGHGRVALPDTQGPQARPAVHAGGDLRRLDAARRQNGAV